ncbi:MAG: hypothetical protein AB7O24_19840 [Kofleriaceae bacterium]
MRPLFPIVFVLMTGCGDDTLVDTDDPADFDPVVDPIDVVDIPTGRLFPYVCAVRSWPDVVPPAKDADLAVVPMNEGAAVLAISRQGGPLFGFRVDGRGLIMGDATGAKVRMDADFTAVTGTFIDSRLVVGLVRDGKVAVTVLRDDLLDFREVGVIDSSFVGEIPMMHVRGERIAMTGGATGMVKSGFNRSWAPTTSEQVADSVPTEMAGAVYGDDAMIAWSNDDGCHLQRVASKIESSRSIRCSNPRLAVNYARRNGVMAFEDGENVWVSDILVSSHNEISNQMHLQDAARAPRVAFDGARFWVSYLNSHGDVTVGILDSHHELMALAIDGTKPGDKGYELAVIGGAVWVFSIDDSGYQAHRLCLASEY